MGKDICYKSQRNSANPAPIIRTLKVKSTDCPLACPMPDQSLWNMHPRVYLAIEETEQVVCPYCGTQYTLEIDAEDTRAS